MEHKTVDFDMLNTLIGKYKNDIMDILNMFGEDFEGRVLRMKQSNDVISERHAKVENRYDLLNDNVTKNAVGIEKLKSDLQEVIRE